LLARSKVDCASSPAAVDNVMYACADTLSTSV
jgi:hypothetical protein